jgi:hypothetical protein
VPDVFPAIISLYVLLQLQLNGQTVPWLKYHSDRSFESDRGVEIKDLPQGRTGISLSFSSFIKPPESSGAFCDLDHVRNLRKVPLDLANEPLLAISHFKSRGSWIEIRENPGST